MRGTLWTRSSGAQLAKLISARAYTTRVWVPIQHGASWGGGGGGGVHDLGVARPKYYEWGVLVCRLPAI